MSRRLRFPGYVRIAAAVVLLLCIYAAAGFWLAPRMLRSALLNDLPKSMGVGCTVGAIRVNPFLLQTEIRDFSLTDAHAQKLLGFERFFVDLQLSSLWHRAYSFVNIELKAPFVNARVAPDGRLNLLELGKASTQPAHTKSSPLPPLRIQSLKVTRGLLAYDDRSRPSDFTARLEPIDFELHDFTTGVEGGRFTFSGTSKLGEKIEWHGHLSVDPLESDGEFRIDALRANTLWTYLEDQLNFKVGAGTVALQGTYKFSVENSLQLQLELPRIEVSNLAVGPKTTDSPAVDWISMQRLTISNSRFDLARRSFGIDSATLEGMKVAASIEPDGSFNLTRLAAAPAAALPTVALPTRALPTAALDAAALAVAPTVPAPTSAPAMPKATVSPAAAGPMRPWALGLREFIVNDAAIVAEDRSARPVAKFSIAPLSARVQGISLELGKPVDVALEAKINESGSLSATGSVTPRPLGADLKLQFADLDLTPLQPYIGQRTSMTLKSGTLSGDTRVLYGAGSPAVQLSGNIGIANLHTIDNALHDDFINWQRLDFAGINFQRAPDKLSIELISTRKAYARFILEPDGSSNVKRVLQGPGATLTVPVAQGNSKAVGVAAVGAPAVGIAASGAMSATAPVPLQSSRLKRAAQRGPAPAAAMPLTVKKVSVQDSELDFADLSVTPNFSAGIQSLQGTIVGLSTAENARARIDLHGAVDSFAPVSISGELSVLGKTLYADVAMTFRNIELSTFNPYSGKFAGYDIAKGKLSTQLHYKVQDRQLNAQHHISIDQLEFGEKTASKEAVSLPIKLAVALLKNRDGVIELDVPVTGSLDDPQFKLGPIIWKVFVNILERAVSAPFELIGALFGGGADLQFIDFDPGAAELDAAGIAKANTIVTALQERPQLKIDVPIAVVDPVDRPQLVEARLREQIAAAAAERKSAAAFDQLDAAARLEILSGLYQKQLGGEPKFPPDLAAGKTKPALVAAKIDYVRDELRARVVITDAELAALGQSRAMNVQKALLNGTPIDPERVFLLESDKAKADNGRVRIQLSLR